MRKIALVSDGRVSHGIYTPVLDEISKHKNLEYMYVVTGMHLSKEFGNTIDYIKKEGYNVAYKIPIDFNNNEDNKQVKYIGKYILELTKLFEKDRPDIILAQGDRGITLASAIVGVHLRIPVAHMHGGEISKTFDGYTRHAVTQYSHIHFPATKKSAERLKLLGQEESRIYLTGSTAVDYVLKQELLSKEELEKELNLDLDGKFVVLLQHPVSEEKGQNGTNFNITINALLESNINKIIIIYPSSDDGSEEIINEIKKLEQSNNKFKTYKSLPFLTYLSLIKHSLFIIGNSSGAIIEAPVLGTPVINIGTRQDGRECAPAIINVNYNKKEILDAINKALYDKDFKEIVSKKISPYNPYNDGKAAERIVNVLENVEINSKLLNKRLTY